MSKQSKGSEPIKVTDKRIFTSDGEIRDEFKSSVVPSDPTTSAPAPPPPPAPEPAAAAAKTEEAARPKTTDRRFAMLVDLLAQNAAMLLGMGRSPYGAQPADLPAARQMIDMLEMLTEKTDGHLSEEEESFLKANVSELKLAYVQRSKAI